MVLIGLCTISLKLHGTNSLKDKRSIIKSLITRLRNQLNISVAEVDSLNDHRQAVVALTAVSRSESVIRSAFSAAEELVERTPGAEVIELVIEML